jgi:hypothetical protein
MEPVGSGGGTPLAGRGHVPTCPFSEEVPAMSSGFLGGRRRPSEHLGRYVRCGQGPRDLADHRGTPTDSRPSPPHSPRSGDKCRRAAAPEESAGSTLWGRLPGALIDVITSGMPPARFHGSSPTVAAGTVGSAKALMVSDRQENYERIGALLRALRNVAQSGEHAQPPRRSRPQPPAPPEKNGMAGDLSRTLNCSSWSLPPARPGRGLRRPGRAARIASPARNAVAASRASNEPTKVRRWR